MCGSQGVHTLLDWLKKMKGWGSALDFVLLVNGMVRPQLVAQVEWGLCDLHVTNGYALLLK
jgi:hypothetical protein